MIDNSVICGYYATKTEEEAKMGIISTVGGILAIAIFLIRFLPCIPVETKIEWIMYLGLPLMFIVGGAAFAYIKNAIIAVITGAIIYAVLQALLQTA